MYKFPYIYTTLLMQGAVNLMLMLAITFILQGAPTMKKEELAQGQKGISIANYERLQGNITPNSTPKSYSKPWRLGATNQAKLLTQASKPLAAASATWLDSATQKPC